MKESEEAEIINTIVDDYERQCHDRLVQIWAMGGEIRGDLLLNESLESQSLNCSEGTTIAVESKNADSLEVAVVIPNTEAIVVYKLERSGYFGVEFFDKETGESPGVIEPKVGEEGYDDLYDMHTALMRYNDVLTKKARPSLGKYDSSKPVD